MDEEHAPREVLNDDRALLVSFSFQFFPETDSARLRALDWFVQRALFTVPNRTYVGVRRISAILNSHFGHEASVIHTRQIDESLISLSRHGLVEVVEDRGTYCYRLTDNAISSLQASIDDGKRLYTRIFEDCFDGLVDGSKTDYESPFWKCLCYVAAERGRFLAQNLVHGQASILGRKQVERIINTISKQFQGVDEATLRIGVARFFNGDTPDASKLKYILVQNYYLLRVLGLDEAGKLLTSEIFQNAKIYLDTNVLIYAIDASSTKYDGILALHRACAKLGITLLALRVSVQEMMAAASYQIGEVEQYSDYVPEEMSDQIRSEFFKRWQAKRLEDPSITIEEAFESYFRPNETLTNELGITIVDDSYFDEVIASSEIKQLKEHIKSRYWNLRRKRKSEAAATHDALLVSWAKRDKATSGQPTFIATFDTTLPGVYLGRGQERSSSNAMIFDGLLSWLTTVTVQEDAIGLVELYGKSLAEQILPLRELFDIGDFRIFEEIDIGAARLGAGEVEELMISLKSSADSLDLTDHRERADKIRKARLYLMNRSTRSKDDVKKLHATRGKERRDYDKEVKELQSRISQQDRMIAELKVEGKKRRVEAQKTIGAFLVFALGLFACYLLTVQYGVGTNLLQRSSSIWGWNSALMAITLLIIITIAGKETLSKSPLARWAMKSTDSD